MACNTDEKTETERKQCSAPNYTWLAIESIIIHPKYKFPTNYIYMIFQHISIYQKLICQVTHTFYPQKAHRKELYITLWASHNWTSFLLEKVVTICKVILVVKSIGPTVTCSNRNEYHKHKCGTKETKYYKVHEKIVWVKFHKVPKRQKLIKLIEVKILVTLWA